MRGGPGLSTHCASLLFLCSPPDLRVFPERYVVCVSRPEDASAHHGNLSLATVSAVYTPPFPLPVTWQKVSRGSVCYYRDAFAKLPSHFMCPNLFFSGGRGSSEPTGLFGGGGGGGGGSGGFLGGVSRGPEAAQSPPSLKAPAHTLCRFAFVRLKHGLVANLNMNG